MYRVWGSCRGFSVLEPLRAPLQDLLHDLPHPLLYYHHSRHILQVISSYQKLQRVLNDLQRAALSCGSMIRLHAHPLHSFIIIIAVTYFRWSHHTKLKAPVTAWCTQRVLKYLQKATLSSGNIIWLHAKILCASTEPTYFVFCRLYPPHPPRHCVARLLPFTSLLPMYRRYGHAYIAYPYDTIGEVSWEPKRRRA